MKKVFLLTLAVSEANSSETIVSGNEVFVIQNVQASAPDIRKGMPYKELKRIYDPKEYIRDVADPYNSGVAGVCSF